MQQVTSTLYLLLPYIVIIGIFYLILIRPQQKKEKETQRMRKNVAEGDEIVTIGGIYGKVLNIKEDIITIEVGADKLKFKIARWAIGRVVNKVESKNETKTENKQEK